MKRLVMAAVAVAAVSVAMPAGAEEVGVGVGVGPGGAGVTIGTGHGDRYRDGDSCSHSATFRAGGDPGELRSPQDRPCGAAVSAGITTEALEQEPASAREAAFVVSVKTGRCDVF